MRRFFFVIGLLPLAACATPDLPGGFSDEQSWFDERVAEGASAGTAPPIVPDKDPAMSAREIDRSAQDVLRARDEVSRDERATRARAADTEEFADEARTRATPPDPID